MPVAWRSLSLVFPTLAALCLGAQARADDAGHAAPGDDTIRVLVIDLQAKGVDPLVAQNLTDLLATALARSGRYSVAGPDDVKSLLTAQAERQLLGCEDDPCFSNVAGLVGAQQVVHGSVGKIGETYVVNVSRVDIAKGQVLERATESAPRADDLIGKVEKLAGSLGSGITPSSTASAVPVERLKGHDACVFAAVQYDRAKKARVKRGQRTFRARFGSEHFSFDEYDKLDEVLPLKPDLAFVGRYPSCFGRENPYEDAFTVKEEKPLVFKVGGDAAYDLIQLRRRRKLVLEVEFEIVGAKLYALKEYDWRSCEDGETKPFRPTDIAPNAYVKVRSAVLLDMFNHRRYAVTRQAWDPGTEKVSLVSLPAPAGASADDDDTGDAPPPAAE